MVKTCFYYITSTILPIYDESEKSWLLPLNHVYQPQNFKMSNLNSLWLWVTTLGHISWNSNIRVTPFSPRAWLLLSSNQALGEKGVTLFFENRKNKKSTSRYLKIMKNGGFLFKIGRKLRPAARCTHGRTDRHLPPAYDINKDKKYHTPPCYPYRRQQREEIQYALTRELKRAYGASWNALTRELKEPKLKLGYQALRARKSLFC